MLVEELIELLKPHVGKRVVVSGFDECGYEDPDIQEVELIFRDHLRRGGHAGRHRAPGDFFPRGDDPVDPQSAIAIV